MPVCLGSLVVTAGYTGAAAVLEQTGFRAGLRRSSDLIMLLIVTIISSGLVASGFVASYAAAGVIPWSGVAEAGFHYWESRRSAAGLDVRDDASASLRITAVRQPRARRLGSG
jgi:hypothetical protein